MVFIVSLILGLAPMPVFADATGDEQGTILPAGDNEPSVPTPDDTSPVPEPPIVSVSDTPVVTPETTPPLVITSLSISSTIEYIELYNQSDAPIDISTLVLYASRAGEPACRQIIAATGWLLADDYLTAASPLAASDGMAPLSSDCLFSGNVERVELYLGDTRIQLVDGIQLPVDSPWLRHRSTVTAACSDKTLPSSLKQTGSAANDYTYCSQPPQPALRSSVLYQPPATTGGLKIVEIMSDSRSCTPDDASYDCFDFIKLQNTGATDVDLADYRLRTGASTTASSASNTFTWQQPTLNPLRDELILHSGDYFTLTRKNSGDLLSITNGDGNVWIEDYFGIIQYQSVSYHDMDLAAAAGKSWAYNVETDNWQYGVPSPNSDNVMYVAPPPGVGAAGEPTDDGLIPCRADQYRNPETNRCRLRETATTLKPCRDGQYRSEETHRCRSIVATVASALKPCADDQFRNPATNRCKKIASTDDLKPCAAGQERNPATNRCRKVATSTIPDAAFAVEPIKDTGKAFVGWWALGGVGLLAIGYAGWEWRYELAASVRRIGQFFGSRR